MFQTFEESCMKKWSTHMPQDNRLPLTVEITGEMSDHDRYFDSL